MTNDWTITDNYWDQQTSLNIDASHHNDDGTYTIVISPKDPGVANWVSTGGLNQGTVSIRFQDLPEELETPPTVTTSRVVTLDELPDFLPPGTEYVDQDGRDDQIAARQKGFNKRFAPFPQT